MLARRGQVVCPLPRQLSGHKRTAPSGAKSTLLTDAVEKGVEVVAEQ
jgi:hypothetical protein